MSDTTERNPMSDETKDVTVREVMALLKSDERYVRFVFRRDGAGYISDNCGYQKFLEWSCVVDLHGKVHGLQLQAAEKRVVEATLKYAAKHAGSQSWGDKEWVEMLDSAHALTGLRVSP